MSIKIPEALAEKPVILRFGLTLLNILVLFVLCWASEANLPEAKFGVETEELGLERFEKPQWMPKSWVHFLEREISPSSGRAIYRGDLREHARIMLESPWIDRVHRFYSDFSGRVDLGLEVSRPVCLIRKGSEVRFANSRGEYMRPFHPKLITLEGGVELPEVQVDELYENPSVRPFGKEWVREVIHYVLQWNAQEFVSKRCQLKKIKLSPVEVGKEMSYNMNLLMYDPENQLDMVVRWGENKEYSVLEQRSREDKWADLLGALRQGAPFRALDLRYRAPGVYYK